MSAERPRLPGGPPAGPAGRVGARAALLVLADGRLPAGGHAHSGGMEAAVVDGGVRGLDDLAGFLRGRLATAGLLSAAFAAAACQIGHGDDETRAPATGDLLAMLDAELDARTPSPAQREASRAQGRTLLRAGRAAWDLAGAALPAAPHHPIKSFSEQSRLRVRRETSTSSMTESHGNKRSTSSIRCAIATLARSSQSAASASPGWPAVAELSLSSRSCSRTASEAT